MIDDVVIQAESLGKKYLIRHGSERYLTLRDTVARRVRALWQKSDESQQIKNPPEEFWALDDINFEIKRGEVVAIIGRNGAGKSTLLKILSRITEPTKGRATIRGRVASLLEVGTGFHPELTGRENVFLNGTILGMRRSEIKRRFDEIVAFAEVEKFIDTPVKHYSSGMNVRLAFAVAAHLEPEILIVDEVLAVGDLEFQKRSLGKIDKIAHSGRTVLFVSHNMPAVAGLCTRGIVLEKGSVIADGGIAKAIALYTAQATGRQKSEGYVLYDGSLPVTSEAAVTRVELFDHNGNRLDGVVADQPVVFRLHYFNRVAVPQCCLTFELRSMSGPYLLKMESNPNVARAGTTPGSHYIDCCIDHLPLAPDQYLLSFGVAIYGVRMLDWADDVATLLVRDSEDPEVQPAQQSAALLTVKHRWIADAK